jgi:site-specific recombinase XerD
MKLMQLIEQFIAYRKSLSEVQGSNGRTLRAFGRAIGSDANVTDVRTEQVVVFLAGTGARTLTWHHKISTLRTFYRFAISRGYVDAAPLPMTTPKCPAPFVPYVYSNDDLRRLLRAIDSNPHPNGCLEPITMRTLVLLLYGTGARIQEVVNLNRSDVDLDRCLLIIRETKFDKTRLVPFGSQLRRTLDQYAKRGSTPGPQTAFFTTRTGIRVKTDTLQHNYRLLCRLASVCRSDGACFQPRFHDLRHTFAVHRLTSWYRQGADVQRLLPLLSVYLGHVHLRHTQVYLSMTPELLHEAGKRFEQYADKEATHA